MRLKFNALDMSRTVFSHRGRVFEALYINIKKVFGTLHLHIVTLYLVMAGAGEIFAAGTARTPSGGFPLWCRMELNDIPDVRDGCVL